MCGRPVFNTVDLHVQEAVFIFEENAMILACLKSELRFLKTF